MSMQVTFEKLFCIKLKLTVLCNFFYKKIREEVEHQGVVISPHFGC